MSSGKYGAQNFQSFSRKIFSMESGRNGVLELNLIKTFQIFQFEILLKYMTVPFCEKFQNFWIFSKKIGSHETPLFENFPKFVNKNAIKH